ncbi:MAG TPA: diacylglycerol kinase family protein [Anaerolineales bacterium]|nr:diacylglycerol kinase family protein [Anaerolineales bacterium]
MPRALLIYNPNAGRFPPETAARRAAERLRAHGWEIDIEPTRDAGHVTELATCAASEGLDALILAGGDGSIGRALRGLIGTSTALGVLPTGTANVWARELGLPRIGPGGQKAVIENAEMLASARVKSVDAGLCNGVPFLLWTGIGLDAIVVRGAERHRSHLKKRLALPEYTLRTLLAAAHWPGAEARITGHRAGGTGQVDFSGALQLAVVTNISRYAGGYAVLSPQAVLDDGEMDLWIFKGRGAGAALRHARNLLRGNHVNDKDTLRIPFTRIEIEFERPVAAHRDGETVPDAGRIAITVCKQALKILCPETTEMRTAPFA